MSTPRKAIEQLQEEFGVKKLYVMDFVGKVYMPPKLELQGVLFRLIHQDQTPMYKDQLNLLQMLQMQNT